MRKSLILLISSALLLTACTSTPAPKLQSAVDASPTAGESATPEPEPEPTQKIDPETGWPIYDGGLSTTTTFPSVSGSGPAFIDVERVRPQSPVYRFSCSDCTGKMYVGLEYPAPGTRLFDMEGPIVDGGTILGFLTPDINRVRIDVNGSWTMVLDQWANLTEASGTIQGRGPMAFRVDPALTSITVTYTALSEFDFLSVDAWKAGTQMAGVGGTHYGSGLPETYELKEARTVALYGPGDWTATFNY